MKQFSCILILLAFLTLITGCKKEAPHILYDTRYKEEIKKVRKEFSVYLSLNNIPGGVLAISIDGKLIYSEAMGMASRDLEVPATRKTKFRIGDVSELFTSLIYQMMIENGTLHPDSTIQFYIPDYPLAEFRQTRNKITLQQLANHSSGIRQANDDELNWQNSGSTVQNSIDLFKNEPLNSIPGWYENQSAFNYQALGAVMEIKTGKTFPELLKEYVTDTLKLGFTEVDNPFRTIIGRTNFFDYNIVAQLINAVFRDLRYRAPSEGLLSNAEDMVKLGNALLFSDVIPDRIKNRMFKTTELKGDFPPVIANGWIVLKNREGLTMYGKVGNITGGGTVLLIIPDKKMVVAGAINATATNEIPVFKLIEPFMKKPEETEQKENGKE